MAADQTIDLSSGYASFGSTTPLLAGCDDVVSFHNLASGTRDFTVSVNSHFTGNLGASLDGTPLAVQGLEVFRFAYLEGQGTTPPLLSIASTSITSPLASYAVTMSVTPVPDPDTYAPMLAGRVCAARCFMPGRCGAHPTIWGLASRPGLGHTLIIDRSRKKPP